MNASLTSAALTIFVIVSSHGCTRSGKPANGVAAEVTTINLGDVSPNAEIERSVQIVNDTVAQRVVETIAVDCACVEKNLSKSVLAPGETADLFLKFQSPSVKGPFSHYVDVRFREGDSKLVVVEGTVGAWFSVSTPAVRFGEATRLEVVRRKCVVTLHEALDDSKRRTEFSLENGSVEREEVSGSNITYDLVFSPNENSSFTSCKGELLIGWEGLDRLIRVPCFGEVTPDWEASPKKVFLGLLQRGDKRELKVRLVNAKNRRFDVEYFVEHDLGDWLSVDLEPSLSQITLQIDSSRMPVGRSSGNVAISNSSAVVLEIPVEAFVE